MIKLFLYEYEDMKNGRNVMNFVFKDRFIFNSMLFFYRFSYFFVYIDVILKLILVSLIEIVVMVKKFF